MADRKKKEVVNIKPCFGDSQTNLDQITPKLRGSDATIELDQPSDEVVARQRALEQKFARQTKGDQRSASGRGSTQSQSFRESRSAVSNLSNLTQPSTNTSPRTSSGLSRMSRRDHRARRGDTGDDESTLKTNICGEVSSIDELVKDHNRIAEEVLPQLNEDNRRKIREGLPCMYHSEKVHWLDIWLTGL